MLCTSKRLFAVLIASVLLLLFLAILLIINRDEKDQLPIIFGAVAKQMAIEKYLLEEDSGRYSGSPGSKLFCAVEVLWEYDLTNTEKIVYAPNHCAGVVLINGDLRHESSRGTSQLFKMKYENNEWIVADADSRTLTLKQPITQKWVKDTEGKVPKNIKNRCSFNSCFSTDGVIKKAAEYFKVRLPEYPLNYCKTSNDCASDSICVISGGYLNPGPNTCVKKCSTNSDCGMAHTCRYECVNGGNNGCPDTAEKICRAELLSSGLEKDPNSFIGFDEYSIHRRRAIAEAYSEFSEDYEKQPCLAGCSVKVVEDSRIFYYAFVVHGSGLSIDKASCFRVDGGWTDTFKVSKIGEFPDRTDLYIGYRDIEPKTCKGIK